MSISPLKIDTYELLTGDAFVTLKTLPDKCIQSVVTSPPYFALRSYNTSPVIFGGDDACAHEWGAEIPGSSRGGSGPNSKSKRTGATKSSYGRASARGSECQLCGAWKGELGLEPTPGCKHPGSRKKVFKLREDLTDDQRQYVIVELMNRGLL